MRRSRSGSFFSVGQPGTRARVGEFWFHKEGKGAGVMQREGARLSTSRGPGLVPGNVEGDLRLARFTIGGREGAPVLGTPISKKGLREKAKERGQWEEGAMLRSKLSSHRGLNADK